MYEQFYLQVYLLTDAIQQILIVCDNQNNLTSYTLGYASMLWMDVHVETCWIELIVTPAATEIITLLGPTAGAISDNTCTEDNG